MKINFKKLNPNAVIPTKAHPTDAGFDLVATSFEYNSVEDWYLYGTGISVEIPDGYVGLLFPRSSNRKKEVYLCNHVGVIDSGYRGEIMFTFKDRTSCDVIDAINDFIQPYDELILEQPYNIGDKIGQLMIIPYPEIEFNEVNELNDSDRGVNGHGSTGK